MRQMTLGLRIDVDTTLGLGRGVPRLAGLLTELGLRATFFMPMGRDRMGRGAARIIRERSVWRSALPYMKTYPWPVLLYGTVISARDFGSTGARIMLELKGLGHEIGIHSFDHSGWQSRVEQLSGREAYDDFAKCVSAYASIFGELPRFSAAPGWRATRLTLFAQDRFGFEFASDTRGYGPFYPEFDGERLRTLQIPVTLPTLDELLIRGEETLDLPHSGTHVYCAHAEVEGLSRLDWFSRLLEGAVQKGNHVVPLSTIARMASEAPGCEVAQGTVPGRSSSALIQVHR